MKTSDVISVASVGIAAIAVGASRIRQQRLWRQLQHDRNRVLTLSAENSQHLEELFSSPNLPLNLLEDVEDLQRLHRLIHRLQTDGTRPDHPLLRSSLREFMDRLNAFEDQLEQELKP